MFTDQVEALREVRPPQWLVHLLDHKPVGRPYKAVLRAILIIVVPLALGLATGQPALGALVSSGGLPMVMADNDAAYRRRAFRLCAAALSALVGYVVGAAVQGHGLLTAIVLVLLALLSVPLGYACRSSGPVGLLFVMAGVVGSAEFFADLPFLGQVGLYALGLAWGLLLGLIGWAVRPTAPERDAVAQVFIQLAAVLYVEDPAVARAARHQLTMALNTAYDRLLRAHSWLSARHSVYTELLTTLSAATGLIEAAAVSVSAGERVPRSIVDYLVHVAAAIRAQSELPEPPAREDTDSVGMAAVYDGLQRLHCAKERTPAAPPSMGQRLRGQFDAVSFDRAMIVALARMGICVIIAEVVAAIFPLPYIHWLTLTVVLVLRPELGSVFGRSVLRSAGTFIGVTLGALVLASHPAGWLLVLIAIACAGTVAVGRATNYWMVSAATTLLIIVQLDSQHLADANVLIERIAHTVAGALIVLVFGYWLWREKPRPDVGAKAADALDAVRAYLAAGLSESDVDDSVRERSIARRKAYRALADLRSTFSQVIVEPSTVGRQALAWWPLIVGLERVTDAITAAVLRERHSQDGVDNVQVTGLIDALDELRDAVRHEREPAVIKLPAGGDFDDVVDQLQVVVGAIRGPGV